MRQEGFNMRETTIGIDLGTTFSCVATIDEHGKPIVLKNEEGKSITPSVVAFEQDGTVIVGDEAKNIQSLGDANVASFFKREMGNPNFYCTFYGKQYSPTDLSAEILAKLKADAEKALGQTVTKAVITCPANFNAIQRREVAKAGKIAGLNVLRVINEPTAAAIAFGITPKKEHGEKQQTLLVYDLGGGTFDVTLMKITAGKIEILATDGNHQLGGKDWDDTLREYAVSQFQEEFAANPLEDSATANDLLVTAENTKKALSQKSTVNFVIAYSGNKGRYTITREQFENATKHLINQTFTFCENVLAAKQTDWKNIDGILLVGGSTRMPQVESELRKRTDKPILHGINVDEVVAIGAAIQADLDANANEKHNEKHYKNLAVYPIRGEDSIFREYLTLEEAMEQKLVVVHETGNVGELSVDNHSDHYVFILSGDIVKGGQQDRTIAEDTILKPRSKGTPLQSFCVEQSRWHQRRDEKANEFSSAKEVLSSRALKRSARVEKQQDAVWENIATYQECVSEALSTSVRDDISPTSLQLTLENENVQAVIDDYVQQIQSCFDGKNDVLGFAFSVNGQISTVEMFGSAALFNKLQHKLLRSAASEAVIASGADADYVHPDDVEVQEFITAAGAAQSERKKTDSDTFSEHHRSSQSDMFETYHLDDCLRTAIYSTDKNVR